MKKTATAVLLNVAASAVAATAPHTPPDLLSSLHHRARPVLIFGSAGDARVNEQYSDLQKHTDGVTERQIRVVLLSATPVGQVQDASSAGPATSVPSPAEQEAIRKRFHVDQGTFAVILVGKDGGEKLRSLQPIPWETLRATIDGMPMRQQEMRQPAR